MKAVSEGTTQGHLGCAPESRFGPEQKSAMLILPVQAGHEGILPGQALCRNQGSHSE